MNKENIQKTKLLNKKVNSEMDLLRIKDINISIPKKYTDNNSYKIISKKEQNSLLAHLITEFFRQTKQNPLIDKDEVEELSFLCEGYFDFVECKQEIGEEYNNEYESILMELENCVNDNEY